MTDTRAEGEAITWLQSILEGEAVTRGYGDWNIERRDHSIIMTDKFARALSAQLAEAQADNATLRNLFERTEAERSALNRELEEWKRGNKAHVAAENVANERCREAQKELAEAQAEKERMRTALRIIAGQEQCIDNLMSNAEVARAALSPPIQSAAKAERTAQKPDMGTPK